MPCAIASNFSSLSSFPSSNDGSSMTLPPSPAKARSDVLFTSFTARPPFSALLPRIAGFAAFTSSSRHASNPRRHCSCVTGIASASFPSTATFVASTRLSSCVQRIFSRNLGSTKPPHSKAPGSPGALGLSASAPILTSAASSAASIAALSSASSTTVFRVSSPASDCTCSLDCCGILGTTSIIAPFAVANTALSRASASASTPTPGSVTISGVVSTAASATTSKTVSRIAAGTASTNVSISALRTA
mmetsp:Transcript_123090/g.347866  ORF Transcript_123090/g.347866 Transcript_123090/m.347866 type:complete len:247 (-) Transcript_123090:592-1332(-)